MQSGDMKLCLLAGAGDIIVHNYIMIADYGTCCGSPGVLIGCERKWLIAVVWEDVDGCSARVGCCKSLAGDGCDPDHAGDILGQDAAGAWVGGFGGFAELDARGTSHRFYFQNYS